MRTAAQASFYLGYILLGVALVSSVLAARRRRDSHRLDIALFVALLFVPPVVALAPDRVSQPLFLTAIRLWPWALLRLVRHLREVPRWMTTGALGVGLLTAPSALVGGDVLAVVRAATTPYMIAAMAAVAGFLVVEAQRSTGVRSRRIALAAAGTALWSVAFVISLAAGTLSSTTVGIAAVTPNLFVKGAGFLCYYFAFSPPRSLLTRWRRREQVRHLVQSMGRDPEERERQAAPDLFDAAVRGVGGAATLVALRSSRADGLGLEVRAGGDDLVGRSLPSDASMVGRVVASGQPLAGTRADCGGSVSQWLGDATHSVLVAPIVATGVQWGVVIVGQRRGALFPEDDLAALAQMAANTATVLDHAQLIAERRERERQIADRKLRAVETRVELILDSIKDYAMLAVDGEGCVTTWHRGAELVFGYPREAITRRSVAGLYGVTPAELTSWLAEAGAWGHVEREGACVRRDGSTFVGATVVRPLVQPPDEPPGFVAVTHDVTEQRTIEERLRQGQKMEAIGQLAGGVAHDFNNLLTAILGYADWLEQGLAGDERHEHVVEIQRAAERAAELTRQLLAFSRRQLLQPSALELTRLVRDLLPMLRRLIGEQIRIVDQMTTDGVVLGDRSQVEQVILNLVVNSRDAMPGGGTLTIRTTEAWLHSSIPAPAGSSAAASPHVLLEVTDTGVGMDEETRQRAFEPFFTTKEVGRGTGLGLSTVYGIVQQMGGEVHVTSAPGQGTTFRFWFPQTSEEAGVTVDAQPSVAHGSGHETVLLVEDDDSLRRYLTYVLESHGYRVIAAEHPRAALTLTESFGDRIDLVISDVVMPGSTGPDLVRLLGRDRPGLSALFISGYADSALVPHATGAVGHELLRKPFSPNELLAKVRQILAAA